MSTTNPQKPGTGSPSAEEAETGGPEDSLARVLGTLASPDSAKDPDSKHKEEID